MLPFIAPIPAQVIEISTQSMWETRTPSQSAEGFELQLITESIYQRFSGGLDTDELDLAYKSMPLKSAPSLHVKYRFIGRIPPMPHSAE